MIDNLFAALKILPPETSHDIAMFFLRKKWSVSFLEKIINKHLSALDPSSGLRLNSSLGNKIELTHPIGLAAGFDKNARALPAMSKLGFSFLEVGTITPRPQSGNPKPRIFRLKDQSCLINRMGFNNDGQEIIRYRLEHFFSQNPSSKPPIGVNVGKNADTPIHKAIDDYTIGLKAFQDFSSYLVINVSSPNTQNLRSLASAEFLDEIQKHCEKSLISKVWVKLDPDREKKDFQHLIEKIAEHQFAGVILTNTHKVEWPYIGGQSGHILSHISNKMLEWAWQVHHGKLKMIGVGGVISGFDVLEKIKKGASAVQIYTGFAYRGPLSVVKILAELMYEMKNQGFKSIEEAFGKDFE